ncbi:MAG: DUF697 domain-containing protein [Fulvivirga sp.]|nr:DUF697 domain-containing protein [Fulvivirga sp.]
MVRLIKRLTIPLAIAVILVFLLFMANQLVALYANLSAIDATLALVVTSFIGVIVTALLSFPFLLYLRLPSSLDYNASPDVYQKQLIRRLAKNKLVKSAKLDVNKQEDLEKVLELLHDQSQTVIKQTATAVFLTTAVSQNGKLDALTVLITQSRMVWKIAHIYWQRPSLKDMIKLYSNVAATALIASEIEDIDISRQVEPIINALLKSPGRSLPVVGHAAHIVTDSLLEGSTNAFLTLRVGIIAQKYCGLTESKDNRALRKSAFVEASAMLKTLVLASSGKVIKSVMDAIKNAGKNTVKSGVESIGKAAGNVKSWFSGKGGKQKDDIQ